MGFVEGEIREVIVVGKPVSENPGNAGSLPVPNFKPVEVVELFQAEGKRINPYFSLLAHKAPNPDEIKYIKVVATNKSVVKQA